MERAIDRSIRLTVPSLQYHPFQHHPDLALQQRSENTLIISYRIVSYPIVQRDESSKDEQTNIQLQCTRGLQPMDGCYYVMLCYAFRYEASKQAKLSNIQSIEYTSMKRIMSNNSPRRRLFRSVALHNVHLYVVQCRADRLIHGRRDKTFATNNNTNFKTKQFLFSALQ
mmetsp:Transcript_15929/g.34557  ORF Transcript_15929/g.34557 Transcript_15929/m.34557 type:complete len:169 (-) Transcript_15929:251-757(-)